MSTGRHLAKTHGQDVDGMQRHSPIKVDLDALHDQLHETEEWNEASSRHVHRGSFVVHPPKDNRRAINPISVKKMDRNAEYSVKRASALAAANNQCQAQLFGCWGTANQTHHIAGRIGEDADTQLLPVCAWCHQQIEEHKVDVYGLGLMKRRVS